jgi:hypothetical protein
LLTNLSRGNVKTQANEVTPKEITLYELAGQGELVAESLQGGSDVDFRDF